MEVPENTPRDDADRGPSKGRPSDEDRHGLVDQRVAHRDLLAKDRLDFIANLSPRQQWAFAYLDAYFDELGDRFSQKVLRRWLEISPSVGPVTRNRSEQLVEILRSPALTEIERTTEPAREGLFRRRRSRREDDEEKQGLFR